MGEEGKASEGSFFGGHKVFSATFGSQDNDPLTKDKWIKVTCLNNFLSVGQL